MLFRLRLGRVRAVFLEYPGQGKFTQSMTDHIFCDKDWIEDFSVVNIEGETDEIRRDHGAARPRLNRRLGLGVLRLLDFVQQVEIDKRTFFNRASHKIT